MKKKNGFTLVELLSAVVILGVLMVVAAGSFTSIKKNNAKKELEQIAVSIKKVGETMYTSSVIRGENLFDSERIENLEKDLEEKDRLWVRSGLNYETKASCPSSQKGTISYGTDSVTYNGCVLFNEKLIESETIENPFNKGSQCYIELKLTKTPEFKSEATILCPNEEPVKSE